MPARSASIGFGEARLPLNTSFPREVEFTMKRGCLRKHAFTTVEMPVVVALVAVLFALLFPVLIKARASARRTTCLNNPRQNNLRTRMYCDDSHACGTIYSDHCETFSG